MFRYLHTLRTYHPLFTPLTLHHHAPNTPNTLHTMRALPPSTTFLSLSLCLCSAPCLSVHTPHTRQMKKGCGERRGVFTRMPPPPPTVDVRCNLYINVVCMYVCVWVCVRVTCRCRCRRVCVCLGVRREGIKVLAKTGHDDTATHDHIVSSTIKLYTDDQTMI